MPITDGFSELAFKIEYQRDTSGVGAGSTSALVPVLIFYLVGIL